MKDFIYGLYQNDNFTLILVIALVVLIIAFVLVYFFGKKDQKLEETKRLQKIELDAFKKVEEKPEKVEVTKEEVKPIFKDTDEEKNPISIDELPKEEVKPIFDNNEEDKKLENDLSSLESIKNEFNSIDIPEVKEEKPIFKPSPQIFSSVFVDKKEENIVSNNEEKSTTKIEKEEVKPTNNKMFSIIDDEDEEVELPSLKTEEESKIDNLNGEVYEIK